MTFGFSIPGLRLGRGLNSREHHLARARRVERERKLTRVFMRGVYRPGNKIQLPAVIFITSSRRGVIDDDNLAGACKAIRDEIATQLGLDDGDARLHWRYKQEKGQRWGVRVELFEGQKPVEILVQVRAEATQSPRPAILEAQDGD